MDDDPNGEEGPRSPTPDDLERIASSLNAVGARYAVLGGFAMQYYGFARPTQDLDLLVDPAPENVERLRQGLSILSDGAVLEVEPTDLVDYGVVRVADEVVVDLLARACDVTFDDAEPRLEHAVVGSARVPYLSIGDLVRSKQTIRPKDAMDRQYLAAIQAEEG